MTMRTITHLFFVAILSLGLITGCASTDEAADNGAVLAEQAIADAKAANDSAKAANNEWRDTGKIIAEAEAKLAAGDTDAATKLANKAKYQADTAVAQAAEENEKFLNENADVAQAEAVAAQSAAAQSKASSSRAGMNGDSVTSYSVERGDSLWNISGKDEVYADPYQWPLIYKTNRDKIKDADLIYPGQVFDIDQDASASEIDAAVDHAKTRGAWSLGDTEQSDLDYLDQ